MPNRIKYDVNAEWDDPFDHLDERRASARCSEEFKIKIAVQVANHAEPLVGEALVQNISLNGVYCRTKHHLAVDQEVQLAIYTHEYPTTQPLPRKFIGSARVIRLREEDDVQEVGLEFGADLAENMTFTLFIENLRRVSQMKAAQ